MVFVTAPRVNCLVMRLFMHVMSLFVVRLLVEVESVNMMTIVIVLMIVILSIEMHRVKMRVMMGSQ